MNTCFGSYTFGDTLVRYLRNEDGQVGLDITPLSLQKKQLTEKMLFAPAVSRFRFNSQAKEAALSARR
jgi:hypothetical protein